MSAMFDCNRCGDVCRVTQGFAQPSREPLHASREDCSRLLARAARPAARLAISPRRPLNALGSLHFISVMDPLPGVIRERTMVESEEDSDGEDDDVVFIRPPKD